MRGVHGGVYRANPLFPRLGGDVLPEGGIGLTPLADSLDPCSRRRVLVIACGRIIDRTVYGDGMLAEHPDGVVVEVWVVPGSSRDRVGGEHDGALRVRTTAPPEEGRANEAVVGLVARRLGVRSAELVSGGTSRRKRVLVRGIDLATARRILGDR